jgi:bacterioferritin (cytochrome b1)
MVTLIITGNRVTVYLFRLLIDTVINKYTVPGIAHEHATLLIQRILFLEGTPATVTRKPEINVGKDVSEMLKNDLDIDIEYKLVKHLREVIAIGEEVKDFETRKILEVLLDGTEMDHAIGSNSRWA